MAILGNLLSLLPDAIAKRFIAEYEWPKGIADDVCPLVKIAPQGETVCIIPREEQHIGGVKPYKSGANIEVDSHEGEELPLTTRRYQVAEKVTEDDYKAYEELGYGDARIRGQVAVDCEARWRTYKEYIVASALGAIASYGTHTHTASNKWDHADGDPLADFETGIAGMSVLPNLILMHRTVYFAMINNAKMKALYQNIAFIDPDKVQNLLNGHFGFNCKLIVVADQYIPRYKGTVTLSDFYPATDAMMLHVDPELGTKLLTAGDPVRAFYVNCTQGGRDEGWIQQPEKGNSAVFVLRDFAKTIKADEACGWFVETVL